MILKDSFISKWTGNMSVFLFQDGLKRIRLAFKKPFRVEKGQAYVVTYDDSTGLTKVYPV